MEISWGNQLFYGNITGNSGNPPNSCSWRNGLDTPKKNMPDHLKGMMINHDKPVDFLMLYVQTNPAAKRMKVVKRATQSGSYLKTDAFKNMLASITRGKKALNGLADWSN